MSYPIATKRGQQEADRAEKILGRKHGGRTHRHHDDDRDDDTASHNIHIVVNGKPPSPMDALAGLGGAGAAPPPPVPPPAPMGPPPGLSGMGGPGPQPPPMGAGAGPGPIAMRRGGRARKEWGGEVAQNPSEAEGSGQMGSAGRDGAPTHRRSGGRTHGGITTAQSKTDGDKFHPDHGTDTEPARKARGGKVQPGGAGGGLGRLWKAGLAK